MSNSIQNQSQNQGGQSYDWSGYRRELSLLIIDKIFLGLIFVFLALHIQAEHEQNMNKREIALEISRVQSDLVKNEYKSFLYNVGILLKRMREAAPYGQVQGEVDKFRELKEKIIKNIDNIWYLCPANTDELKKEFEKKLIEVHTNMISEKRNTQQVEADISAVIAKYRKLLGRLREISIQAAVNDIKAVDEYFGRK